MNVMTIDNLEGVLSAGEVKIKRRILNDRMKEVVK